MAFLSLSLYNFRNIKNERLDLSNREIFFVGENGQGKSNLLEALYYTAYGNSFRTHADTQITKYGEKEFSVSAMYQNENNSTQKINVIFSDGKKQIEKNSKKIKDRKEMVNTIPCVLFCHDDLRFADGDPSYRRFFLDQSLSLYDALYIDTLRNFKKVLKNRNICLKERRYELLDVYDEQFATEGLEIQRKRKNAIFEFNEIFKNLYEKISGISDVNILYAPSWKEVSEKSCSHFPTQSDIMELLHQKREQDKIMFTTMSGPQRDRIIFMHEGRQFIPSASTGQRRLVALLLRVAQAVYYTRLTGTKPVLLMDDVMLELDPDKRQKMTALLPEYEQLFCTFLPGEPYERYKRTTTKICFVENGEVKFEQ